MLTEAIGRIFHFFVFSLQHPEFYMIFFKSSGVKLGYLDHSDVPIRWKNIE